MKLPQDGIQSLDVVLRYSTIMSLVSRQRAADLFLMPSSILRSVAE